MKAGDYVRTKDGVIAKIEDIIADYSIDCDRDVFHAFSNNAPDVMEIPYALKDEYIIKHSPNIIDLIEVGDYVNGMKITNKYIDEETDNIELEFNNGSSYLYPKSWNYEARSEEYKIKSIVTSEQFSQMEYRIGE